MIQPSIDSAIDRIWHISAVCERDKGALWRVLTHITEEPHRTLAIERPFVDVGEASAITADMLTESLLEPEAVSFTHRKAHFTKGGEKWRFLKVYDERARLHHDTAPNQVTAHFLKITLNALRTCLKALAKARRQVSAPPPEWGEALTEGQRLRRRLQAMFHRHEAIELASRLDRIPLNNLVLNHDPNYRRVLHAYLDVVGQ